MDWWTNISTGRWDAGSPKSLVHTRRVTEPGFYRRHPAGAGFGLAFCPRGLLGPRCGVRFYCKCSAIVDCVDGDLARVLFKESRMGKWLDIVGDQVVHFSVFVSIGVGLYRAPYREPCPVLLLAASAAIGVVISFAVVVAHGLLQPEDQRSTRLQKLVDATTNRDFSVLLIFLAVVGKLAWFLWMSAIRGADVYWLLALSVQLVWPAGACRPKYENRRERDCFGVGPGFVWLVHLPTGLARFLQI